MEAILLIARLILAAVFGVAGIAKLFDREGSGKAVADFGAPESLAKPLGIGLPVVEIAVAVLLLPLETAWFGAVGALVLLLAFTGGIALNMARGNAPDCHCFGQIHSEPVGWSTLIRNLLLSAVAAFLVFAGRESAGTSAFAWLADLSMGERVNLVLGLIIVSLLAYFAVILSRVSRQQLMLQRQLEILQLEGGEGRETERETIVPPVSSLPVGAVAPDFVLPDVTGKEVSLADLLQNKKPILLLVVAANCKPCQELVGDINNWHREFGEKVSVVLVSSGKAKENGEKFGEDKTILLQTKFEVGKLFHANWTPSGLFINADGTIGTKLRVGNDELRNLVGEIRAKFVNLNGHAPPKLLIANEADANGKPKINHPAPDFILPDLDGRQISLASFRGKKTLLLFWRNGCGYCQKMLDGLREWERAASAGTNLVLISSGEAEKNRELNLKSPILLESAREIQELFGVNATPSAILLDPNGKIVSETAIGEDDAFALVGHYKNEF